MIVELGKSGALIIETPFTFNSLIGDLSYLRELSSSLINCQVLRGSLSVSINRLFYKYDSLADLILVFTLLRILLKFAQSCGLLDLTALIFNTSRMCMRCFKSIEIQGEFLEPWIWLERISACLSTISGSFVFYSDQSWLRSSFRFKNSQSWLQMSLQKSERLQFLKLLLVIELWPLGNQLIIYDKHTQGDFTFSGKPLIFLTRWGIFYGWWRRWRPVTSPLNGRHLGLYQEVRNH